MFCRMKSALSVNIRRVQPYTIINIKPYWVLMRCGKILCDEEMDMPFVFDTKEFAQIFAELNDEKDCEFRKMELEEILRLCRDSKVHFDSFILIDKWAQLGID